MQHNRLSLETLGDGGALELFDDSGDAKQVLKLVGNMRSEQIRTSEDDGVTQVVGTRAGIVMKAQTEVPNPVRSVLRGRRRVEARGHREDQAIPGRGDYCATDHCVISGFFLASGL